MKKHIFTRASLLARLSAIACIFVFATAATLDKPQNDETMKAATFRTYTGMKTFFSDDFEFDFKCTIQSFELLYQRHRDDALVVPNHGAIFSKQVRNAVKNAKPGDIYVFNKIVARCPGDAAGRKLPSVVVTVR
jgi:hypothetical protein